MTFMLTVLYPSEAELDLEYYTKQHIPFGLKAFSSDIVSWAVYSFPAGGIYSAEVVLEWSSEEAMKKSMGSVQGQEWLKDVPNFSKRQPLVFNRETVASSSST